MKSAQTVRIRFNKRGIKKSDRRHRGLLRARRERPRSRAAEQRNELTPPHVGHGASSPPATRGPVSSACHNAAGKSFGQGPEFRSAKTRPATRYAARHCGACIVSCFPIAAAEAERAKNKRGAGALGIKTARGGLSPRTRGLGRLHPLPSAAHGILYEAPSDQRATGRGEGKPRGSFIWLTI